MKAKFSDSNIPGTVKAVVARRNDSLRHQVGAKISNATNIQTIGKMLNRIAKNG